MDFEGSLDEVRFYNRSFTDGDVAILYGHGNGDLGLTPIITLDSANASPSTTGRVEFLQFGQSHLVTGLNESDFQVSGGTLSNLTLNGIGYDFDFSVSGYPALIEIELPAGVASLGASENMSAFNSFVKAPAITAQDSLTLWYTFNDLNTSLVVEDFSGNQVDGIVTAGELVPGKFNNALLLTPGQYLSVNSELLSLAQSFTFSLWAKVLDDSFGVLARNGQFSLQYHDDNIIRGYASTSGGWRDANARLPSGRWVHYVLSYDGSDIRLYFDGEIVSEASHSGYLAWGDGGDHNLYLNRFSSAGWEAKAVYDDLRIYDRSLTASEVGLLWAGGAGDLGLSPLISGQDPFYMIPSPHVVSFAENNQTVAVAGLLQSEINATNGSIVSFNSGDFSFDLNVTNSPETVRIEIPQGAVVKDGNLSAAGASEFRRRIITSVEDDLLAWYPMDDFNGSSIYDMSGRMRHGTYFGFDATLSGAGKYNSLSIKQYLHRNKGI